MSTPRKTKQIQPRAAVEKTVEQQIHGIAYGIDQDPGGSRRRLGRGAPMSATVELFDGADPSLLRRLMDAGEQMSAKDQQLLMQAMDPDFYFAQLIFEGRDLETLKEAASEVKKLRSLPPTDEEMFDRMAAWLNANPEWSAKSTYLDKLDKPKAKAKAKTRPARRSVRR